MSKTSLRKEIRTLLSTKLSEADVRIQSTQIKDNLLSYLKDSGKFQNANVGVFLPLIRKSQQFSLEVDTYPILEDLFSSKYRLFAPTVLSGYGTDEVAKMTFSAVGPDMAAVHNLPRSKWGIPEPEVRFANSKESYSKNNVREEPMLDVLLVPGVGFGYTELYEIYRCGQGKGFYDRYIAENRSRSSIKGQEGVTRNMYCIGLSLNEQIVEPVSRLIDVTDEWDAKLDCLITPEGVIVSNPPDND